jgi:hypothetical protein
VRVETKSGKRTLDIDARRASFMKKVDIQDNGCWRWNGSTIHSGYGQASVLGHRTTAHRGAYLLFVGHITDGMVVCHSCDNRWCVNPSHMWIGTQADNIEDMRRKGRSNQVKGERHASAKLAPHQVMSIRTDHRDVAVVASDYGIAKCTVRNIQALRKWRHI